MKIYYFPDGEIWNAIADRDLFTVLPDANTQVLEVNEIAENQSLVIQMTQQATYKNSEGLGRWYVQAGELYERDGWEAEQP